METGDTVTVVATLALLLGVVIAILIVVHRGNLRTKAEKEDRLRLIEHGVKQGICDVSGMPLCVSCKKLGEDIEATEHTPITGQGWWDRRPSVSKMRQLWAQAERDIVVDDELRGPRLCRNHKTIAVRKLKEVHEEIRAQTISFNAHQREKIAYMDSGGTEAMVVTTSKKFRDNLNFEDPLSAISEPQLESSTESVALGVSSSIEPTSEEPGE